jgi:hypothetical protein
MHFSAKAIPCARRWRKRAPIDRALPMLCRGDQRIAAEAAMSGETVVVQLRDEAVCGTALPT